MLEAAKMELRNAETRSTGANPGQQHSGWVGEQDIALPPQGFPVASEPHKGDDSSIP